MTACAISTFAAWTAQCAYKNLGNMTFKDVTAERALGSHQFSTGACLLTLMAMKTGLVVSGFGKFTCFSNEAMAG